jgi:hypothetical protein
VSDLHPKATDRAPAILHSTARHPLSLQRFFAKKTPTPPPLLPSLGPQPPSPDANQNPLPPWSATWISTAAPAVPCRCSVEPASASRPSVRQCHAAPLRAAAANGQGFRASLLFASYGTGRRTARARLQRSRPASGEGRPAQRRWSACAHRRWPGGRAGDQDFWHPFCLFFGADCCGADCCVCAAIV